jgi:hypothetical protein
MFESTCATATIITSYLNAKSRLQGYIIRTFITIPVLTLGEILQWMLKSPEGGASRQLNLHSNHVS